MDAFEYLSVLISIVLGLALTQLLTSAGRLVQARARVRSYWPALVWMGTLLVILVQTWWAIFGFREEPSWNVGEFALILAHPILLYFMTVLVLPDAEVEGRIDLQANYYAQTPWFFTALAGVIVLSLLRPVVFDGRLPLDADRLAQLAFLAIAVAAALTRDRRFHAALAATAPAGMALYVGALFFQLG